MRVVRVAILTVLAVFPRGARGQVAPVDTVRLAASIEQLRASMGSIVDVSQESDLLSYFRRKFGKSCLDLTITMGTGFTG